MDFLNALELSLATEKHMWRFQEEAYAAAARKRGYTFVHTPTETAILLEITTDENNHVVSQQLSFIEVMMVQGKYRQLANSSNNTTVEIPEDSDIYANLMEIRDVEKLFEHVNHTSDFINHVMSSFKNP